LRRIEYSVCTASAIVTLIEGLMDGKNSLRKI